MPLNSLWCVAVSVVAGDEMLMWPDQLQLATVGGASTEVPRFQARPPAMGFMVMLHKAFDCFD